MPAGATPAGTLVASGAPWLPEASPSPVYGAALLMRLGASTPSRVRIPEPPHRPLTCAFAVSTVHSGSSMDSWTRLRGDVGRNCGCHGWRQQPGHTPAPRPTAV